MPSYQFHHADSLASPDIFWANEAKRIDWVKPFNQVCDFSCPPFAKWFVGGETNLCYNTLDRHLIARPDQNALVWISSEVEETRHYTYRQLFVEVNRFAAVLKSLGVGKGDRVLIYMPMIPEAVFAMLATVRIGAIHSVVFGGFAAAPLALRIDDAKPKVIITADAGSRGGRVIPLKPLTDEAIKLAQFPPKHVVIVNRRLDKAMQVLPGRDMDYAALSSRHAGEIVPCEWVESSHPSYILYTSGTTGRPKGVARDTGGYAVALASSMPNIFATNPGEAFFCTSDIGWVVGHSYIVYAPLINGSTTIMYEGLPVKPDASIWWKIVEQYNVVAMSSSPTAIRVLKKYDAAHLKKYNVSSLRYLFLAGEPLDKPTSQWIEQGLDVKVIDNYWQTETGWPILSAQPGVEDLARKCGSPGFPVYGYNVKLKHDETGNCVGANEKGVLCIVPPLPPGCMTTIWGDDQRFVDTYFSMFSDEQVYTTFDWATRDDEGYYFIMGRTDDVINVAGHRIGTREIEEAIQTHPNIVEVAVVGVADALKGQVPIAFVVLKNIDENANFGVKEGVKAASNVVSADTFARFEREIMAAVDHSLGAIGRPSLVYFVNTLPKTRSGKLLRRAIQAVCEGIDPGDLSTIEDPLALAAVEAAIKR